MTTDIVPYANPDALAQLEAFAQKIAPSALLPETLRGKPGDVLITIMTGAELGLSPMQSLRSIHVVKGKAILSAEGC